MIVYWDGYGLVDEASGVFQHALHLVHELAGRHISPHLVTSSAGRTKLATLPREILNDWPLLGKLAGSKLVWPRRVRRKVAELARSSREPAILHGLSNINLAAATPKAGDGLRTVLTVHDLIPLLVPGGVSPAYHWQFSWALPRAVAAADRIVCVSNWTRKCLVAHLPECAAKTVVIPNGRPDFVGSSKAGELKGRPEAAPRRLLMVARGEAYKRLELFLEIVDALGPRVEADLVTDARGAARARGFWQERPKTAGASRVRLHQNCDRRKLDTLYEQADAYVHTSLFEGYGLPPVEALIHGTPVVYLAGTGLDEAVGGAAARAVARADGDRLDAWMAAVEAVLPLAADPAFGGLVQTQLALRPTWRDAAQSLESLYNDLIAMRARC